jgi:predicted short-subunit dehydrogenase-like oxidoreductase (DUF2520 family)
MIFWKYIPGNSLIFPLGSVTFFCERYSGKKLHRMISVVTKWGDNMKIGFIGAGRAGCSLGKYFCEHENFQGHQVSGYYSLTRENASWAASFTSSKVFETVGEAAKESDTMIISTPDGAISTVWELLKKEKVKGKVICHLSGSLSSDVFQGVEEAGAYPISIHPLFAFSDKESVYLQLQSADFTLEGHPYAVKLWQELFSALSNDTVVIDKGVKQKYHAAASLLSNHVLAVLQTGYELLEECGFTPQEARSFSRLLVQENVAHAIENGCVAALTGPIERGDVKTVQGHLAVLHPAQRELYLACTRKLLELAKIKHPDRDYGDLFGAKIGGD